MRDPKTDPKRGDVLKGPDTPFGHGLYVVILADAYMVEWVDANGQPPTIDGCTLIEWKSNSADDCVIVRAR